MKLLITTSVDYLESLHHDFWEETLLFQMHFFFFSALSTTSKVSSSSIIPERRQTSLRSITPKLGNPERPAFKFSCYNEGGEGSFITHLCCISLRRHVALSTGLIFRRLSCINERFTLGIKLTAHTEKEKRKT